MRPGSYQMTLHKGTTTRLTFTPQNDDGTAWNLSGRTARFAVLDPEDAVVLDLGASVVANGSCQVAGNIVNLHITVAGCAVLAAATGPLVYQLDLVGTDTDRILVGELEIGRGA